MSNRTLFLIFKEPPRIAGYDEQGENAFRADPLEMLESDLINNRNHVIRTEARRVQLFETPLVSQRLRPAAFLVSLVP